MENALLITALVFGFIILLLASGMWISGALGVVGLFLLFFVTSGGMQRMIGTIMFNSMAVYTYLALPLFIFMGEIILYSGLSVKLYKGVNSWVGFLPGGLLLTNIASCAIFSAVSGSSMATAATVGTVAIPELEKRGYEKKILLGTLAAGGTLGILIPPSSPLIIYGSFVEVSVGQLFIAGVIPGLVLTGLFMAYIFAACLIRPSLAGEKTQFSLKAVITSLFDIWPIALLVFLVLVTIYLGLATATEASALGAFGALVFCDAYRKLTWRIFLNSSLAALKVTCWCMLIIIGAQMLTIGLGMLKVPGQIAQMVVSLGVSPPIIVTVITALYIVLGMFVEAISMMLLTLPVIFPLMVSLGFDPVWIGIYMVVMIEMAQITPPVGVNLFVIQGISGEKDIRTVAAGAIPFVGCLVLLVVLLVAFPNLALWLPAKMLG